MAIQTTGDGRHHAYLTGDLRLVMASREVVYVDSKRGYGHGQVVGTWKSGKGYRSFGKHGRRWCLRTQSTQSRRSVYASDQSDRPRCRHAKAIVSIPTAYVSSRMEHSTTELTVDALSL